jgi:hypothetical protein
LTTTRSIRGKQRRTPPYEKSGPSAVDTPQKTDCLEFVTGSTTLHSYSYTYDALSDQSQITSDGTTTTYS